MTSDRESGGGGMTGATGDLTPDAPTEDFEPGERREVEGADPPADSAGRPDDHNGARAAEPQVGGDDLTDEPERF